MHEVRAILVAEDNELIRLVMCEVLIDRGFRPVSAATTEEALTLIDAKPDLCAAFLDIDLPEPGGGYRVARRLHQVSPHVKIIYTSGGARSDFEAQRVEDAVFVPKPYRPDTVCDLIAQRMS